MSFLLLLVACTASRADAPSSIPATEIVQVPTDYWTDRAGHPTRLTDHHPSPQRWEEPEKVDGIDAVTFAGPVGQLKGWLWPASGRGPHAAVVYFHGGFAFGLSDLADCQPLHDAGFTVFAPTLRGENGNPGDYQEYFGEVDDAVAAVRWLAARADVDGKHVYTFGHSAGGVISGMMALVPDLPVVATGSAGGVYPEQTFTAFRQPHPFDILDATERRLRGWVHYLGSMKRPHHAWVGRNDWLARWIPELEAKAKATHAPLVITPVDGDHFESLAPAMIAFSAEIQGR